MRLVLVAGSALLGAGALLAVGAAGQTQVLRASAGHDAELVERAAGVPALAQSDVTLRVRLTQADAAKRGEVWLAIAAEADGNEAARSGPAKVTLRIPLSSTEDVYGESRACKAGPGGALEMKFSAGMDEENFVRFAAGSAEKEIRLSVNKYLCRALAAPFHCDGREAALPKDWGAWRVGGTSELLLTSDAPAAVAASPVKIEQSGRAFDPASCAVIAPSNGMCCVAGKSTEWHCGGSPKGAGWHKVSGECWHRETGGSCTDKTVFGPLRPME